MCFENKIQYKIADEKDINGTMLSLWFSRELGDA